MVDFDKGFGRILHDARENSAVRWVVIIVAFLCMAISFWLAWYTRLGHFFGLSLVTVILLAWLGGWRLGLVAGLAVPLCSVPIPLSIGLPVAAVFRDTLAFTFMSLVCGGAVGLLSTMFGQAVSTQRRIQLLYRILPICSHCHKIRQENEEWLSLESFFHTNSETRFSHGICPSCLEEHYSAGPDGKLE